MSSKTKVAYIGLAGVIAAALISGVFLYLSQHSDSSNKSTSTSNSSRVTVNVAPATTPPAQPTLKPFRGSVFHLLVGYCADVYSQPQTLQEDILGCINAETSVYIYCTVESQSVGNSSLWDEIYYPTNWGTTGYVPDYYVNTGTNNAVMPSCVT